MEPAKNVHPSPALPFKRVLANGIKKEDQPQPRLKSKSETLPDVSRERIHDHRPTPSVTDAWFSELQLVYKFCKNMALSPQLASKRSSRPNAWVKIIDRRLEDIQKAREQWHVKFGQDVKTWTSIVRATDQEHITSKFQVIMALQVRRLRQLCTGDMAKLARHFDLVDKAYSSDRNESYDGRIRRVLDDAYDQYIRAHDKMRQKQWEASISSEAQTPKPKARRTKRETKRETKGETKKRGEVIGEPKERVSFDAARRNAVWFKRVQNM